MKNKKLFLAITSSLLTLQIFSQAQIKNDDLKSLIGNWEGSITYLDYKTKKPFTMRANLVVEKGKSENSLVLHNIYPSEHKANNKDKIKVTQEGRLLNKKPITKREIAENGEVLIQTEYQAKDDNREALIRYSYRISKNSFRIIKEVQFQDSDSWIKRSEYSYLRK